MSKLTKDSRDALNGEDFAVPGKRALPIHDAKHVRMAWDMVSKTKGLSSADRAEARRRILSRAKKFGIDTSDWQKGQISAVSMRARSLDIPNDAHPNKMPFSGVLTRIDEPSDSAPEGSGGRRVTLTMEAAERALDSLLGMAVDYVDDFSGHDPQQKIGFISGATIEDNAILIDGFLYAADFPEIAAEIKANKSSLGFSFEARDIYTRDREADPIPISECVFTGAAILMKDKAAYHSTSISARAEEDIMLNEETKKEFTELLAAALKPVADAVTEQGKAIAELQNVPGKIQAANHLSKVEPFAGKLETMASDVENAGIGGDPRRGHAAVLRAMAANLRSEAAMGRLPATFDAMYFAADAGTKTDAAVEAAVKTATDKLGVKIAEITAASDTKVATLTDSLKAAETKIADLQAAAARAATAPERKTVSGEVAGDPLKLLAKAGIQAPKEGEKLTEDQIEKLCAGKSTHERMVLKSDLARKGLID